MFSDPQINLYVADVEASTAFYADHFGFVETFRTPKQGAPIHVELKLGDFTLGLAAVDSVRSLHGFSAGTAPSAEVALWAEDVDAAYATLTAAGVRTLSPPHDFLDGVLRATWLADPDGHAVQLVSRCEAAHPVAT
ncbi:MAG TPA: VOC family protein [Jatrophihabitans sp.]|jgi:catechol 2,3-dioxygenase-like lactoylglutathione lyase family enzyme|nr:VOC family protein [Jatrophihabitans sp.]